MVCDFMKNKHENVVDKVFEEVKHKNNETEIEDFDCLKTKGLISLSKLFTMEFVALLLICVVGIIIITII